MADARYRVDRGVVHVWIADVGDAAFLALGAPGAAAPGLVSEADEARAAAFVDPQAGVRLRARRVLLRMILARYAACEPSDVTIVTAPGGKPVLLPASAGEATCAFSVGHSGDLYVVAVARSGSAGIDVERLRSVERGLAIAERWFGSREAATLAGLESDALDLSFMRLWTEKEALAKRHGAGLRLMKGQGESPDVHDELDVERERKSGRLVRVPMPTGYVAALASTDAITAVECIDKGDPRWII